MSLRLNAASSKTPPSLPDSKQTLIVAMLRQMVGSLLPSELAELITWERVPEVYAKRTAEFIADKPQLWNVSDEEFLAAVHEADPRYAVLLATPRGIDFLHRMSRAIAVHTAVIRVKGIFGG